MKKILFIVTGIFIGFITYAVTAGVVAAIFTILANSGWNPSSTITTILGLFSEILKWGITIYVGYKTYTSLFKKYSNTVVKRPDENS